MIPDLEQHKFLDFCKDQMWNTVKEKLNKNRDLINVRSSNKRFSALHQAAKFGNADIVQYLVSKGADMNAQTRHDEKSTADRNKTPLELARSRGPRDPNRLAVVNYLELQTLGDEVVQGTAAQADAQALRAQLGEVTKAVAIRLLRRLHDSGHRPPETGGILPDFSFPVEYQSLRDEMEGMKLKDANDVADNTVRQLFGKMAMMMGTPKEDKLFTELKLMLDNSIFKDSEARKSRPVFQHMPVSNIAGKWPEEMLLLMLQRNPFFAPSVSRQYKKFFSYHMPGRKVDLDGDGGKMVLTSLPVPPGEHPTHFQKITDCLDHKYPRFCAWMPNPLETAMVFEYDLDQGKYIDATDKYDAKQKMDAIVTTLLFYAECLHALIHIYQFVMCGGLLAASKQIKELEPLVALYVPNVAFKYNQVHNLLLDEAVGILTNDSYVSNPRQLHKALGELLADWGRCKSSKDMIEFFKPPVHVEREGYLKEFVEQADLIPQFAMEIAGTFPPEASGVKFQGFFKLLGPKPGFALQNLQDFLELMALTGLVHGSTLSFTRLFFTSSGISSMSKGKAGLTETNFNEPDFNVCAVAAATMIGLADGHEVFPDIDQVVRHQPDEPDAEGGALQRRFADTQPLFKKHKKSSDELKAHALKSSEESLQGKFDSYGWVLSDFFPSNYSGNQATIATYI